jgi:hypothetical protein
VNYEVFFVSIKERVLGDLRGNFEPTKLDTLSLALGYQSQSAQSNDHYRSKTSKVPAYYNPNTHTVHLNIEVLEKASDRLIENIYYHELLHATSHHARLTLRNGTNVLKSGLKIQAWDLG